MGKGRTHHNDGDLISAAIGAHKLAAAAEARAGNMQNRLDEQFGISRAEFTATAVTPVVTPDKNEVHLARRDFVLSD